MDNQNTNTFEILGQCLGKAFAEMTERAIEAERKMKEAQKRADDWYKSWQRKEEDYKELQTALSVEIREHQKTKAELEEAVRVVNVLDNELERMRKPEPAETAQRSAKDRAPCREKA